LSNTDRADRKAQPQILATNNSRSESIFCLTAFRQADRGLSRSNTSRPHEPTTSTAECVSARLPAETIRRRAIVSPRPSSSVEKRRDTQGHDDERLALTPL